MRMSKGALAEDPPLVAQRVNQETTDHDLPLPLEQSIKREGGERSQRVLADSGFFTIANVRQREAAEIDASVPDADSAPELNGRVRPMPAEAGLPQAGVYPSLSLLSVPR